jgi:quercetin dioxygenase-like cupin family protein
MPTEFEHPNGERLKFLKTAADTNGELLEMEAAYNPNSRQPPLHTHPKQEEKFEVLSGTFRVRIGDEEHTFETGDKFSVPVNTPHWMYNMSDQEGRLRWEIRPAMKSQDFFATIWGLSADALPNIIHYAVILNEYRNEFRASNPPYVLQRILFTILAPIGRRMGYKARYEKYGGELVGGE